MTLLFACLKRADDVRRVVADDDMDNRVRMSSVNQGYVAVSLFGRAHLDKR